MAKDSNEMQVSEKREVAGTAEDTRPGQVFTPAVDIFETDDAITVLADMPGVAVDDLTIDLRENVLTLTGSVTDLENEDRTALLQEYETGSYYRQFRVSNAIDQAKIDASMKDGVLRLVLPKAEASRPRKIEVKTA
jgi:HSP20 family molecular chaperone IbpA